MCRGSRLSWGEFVHRLTCQVCSSEFDSRTRNGKFCQPKCQWTDSRAKRKASGALAAYRTAHREQRASYMATYTRIFPCAACGAPLERRGTVSRRPACDSRCRRYLQDEFWPHSQVPQGHAIRSSPVPERHPVRQSNCLQCSAEFVIAWRGQMYCARACADRASETRRDARKRSNTPLPRRPCAGTSSIRVTRGYASCVALP